MKPERTPFHGPQPVPTPRAVSPELQALYDERAAAFRAVQRAKEALGKAENELHAIKQRIVEWRCSHAEKNYR